MLGGENNQRPTIPKRSKSLLVKARIISMQHATLLMEHKLDLVTNCCADGMPRVECLLTLVQWEVEVPAQASPAHMPRLFGHSSSCNMFSGEHTGTNPKSHCSPSLLASPL